MHKYHIVSALLAAMAAVVPASAKELSTVKSPDGSLTLNISDDDNGVICYTLSRGAKTLVEKSTVGINCSEGDFSSGLSVKAVNTADINSSYSLPYGGEQADICREVSVEVAKDSGSARFVFRLYDEGLAWRYIIEGSGSASISGESGVCNPAMQGDILTLPLCQGTRSSFAVSDPALLMCMKVAALPLMIRNNSDDDYLVLAETAPLSEYCGSRLTVDDNGGYKFSPVESVTATLPARTPWRMILTGSLADIAQSSMAESLAEPSAISDCSWIKPGRATDAYAGHDHSAAYLNTEIINSYIDWTARQGWEYFTLDKSWSSNGISLKDVVSYARSKNVGVFVWLNRHTLPQNEGSLRTALQEIKVAGAKGIKVEFWEDESQASVDMRNSLLKVAAEKQLMVILSNSVNTAGLHRTWPNLMATETGLNNSSYVFTPDAVGAAHNINSAILRSAWGPVDYYPVDFAETNGKLLQSVTHAHQLALALAFRSGVQHIGDAPDNLRYSVVKNLLKDLPAAWDESRCLEAVANEYLAVARRSGSDHYVGALTAEARTAEIPLSFLARGSKVNAYIYRDGNCPTDIAFEYRSGLTAESTLSIPMARNGGFVVRLTDDDGSAKPFCATYEAEAADNTIPFGVSVLGDTDSLCSGGEYVSGAGNSRPLTFRGISVPKPGTYAVTVYYMASEATSGYLQLNGSLASIRGLNFINSGGTGGRALAQTTATVVFDRAEGNYLELSSTRNLPAIDRICITDNETTEYAAIEESTAACGNTNSVYAADGTIVIEATDNADYLIHDVSGRLLAAGRAAKGINRIRPDFRGVMIVSLIGAGRTEATKIILE